MNPATNTDLVGRKELQIIHHFCVMTSAESTSRVCVLESQWQTQIQMSRLCYVPWVLPHHHHHFLFPSWGHFGRFKGFQPNLTGSTQTPGALPRAEPDYVNKVASSTGELQTGMQELWELPWISFICSKRQFPIKTNFKSCQRKLFPIGTRPS